MAVPAAWKLSPAWAKNGAKKARISLVIVSLTHVRKSLLHELGFGSVGTGGTEDVLTKSNARFCLAAD